MGNISKLHGMLWPYGKQRLPDLDGLAGESELVDDRTKALPNFPLAGGNKVTHPKHGIIS